MSAVAKASASSKRPSRSGVVIGSAHAVSPPGPSGRSGASRKSASMAAPRRLASPAMPAMLAASTPTARLWPGPYGSAPPAR